MAYISYASESIFAKVEAHIKEERDPVIIGLLMNDRLQCLHKKQNQVMDKWWTKFILLKFLHDGNQYWWECMHHEFIKSTHVHPPTSQKETFYTTIYFYVFLTDHCDIWNSECNIIRLTCIKNYIVRGKIDLLYFKVLARGCVIH